MNNNRNILVLKRRLTQLPKIVVKLLKWNGYPEIFRFSQALEISRQYLFLRTVVKKKFIK